MRTNCLRRMMNPRARTDVRRSGHAPPRNATGETGLTRRQEDEHRRPAPQADPASSERAVGPPGRWWPPAVDEGAPEAGGTNPVRGGAQNPGGMQGDKPGRRGGGGQGRIAGAKADRTDLRQIADGPALPAAPFRGCGGTDGEDARKLSRGPAGAAARWNALTAICASRLNTAIPAARRAGVVRNAVAIILALNEPSWSRAAPSPGDA